MSNTIGCNWSKLIRQPFATEVTRILHSLLLNRIQLSPDFICTKDFFRPISLLLKQSKSVFGLWLWSCRLHSALQCGHTFQATRLSSRDSKWKGLSSSKWQNLSSSNWCEIVPMQADVRYWSYPFTSRFPTRATFRQRKSGVTVGKIHLLQNGFVFSKIVRFIFWICTKYYFERNVEMIKPIV